MPKKPFVPKTPEEWQWWTRQQRYQNKQQDRRDPLERSLIFDVDFSQRSLTDKISGATASFERASTGGYIRGGNEIIAPIDTPRFADEVDGVYSGLGLLLEGSEATDPITGLARATEAADASGNGVSWLLDDIPLVKAALQTEGTMVLDWVPGFDKDDVTSTAGYVSVIDSFQSILKFAPAGQIQTTNGTTFVTATDNYLSGEGLKASVTWDGTEITLRFKSSKVSTLSYGLPPIGTMLRLHYANELTAQYKRLRFYDRALIDEEIANV